MHACFYLFVYLFPNENRQKEYIYFVKMYVTCRKRRGGPHKVYIMTMISVRMSGCPSINHFAP